MRGTNQRPAAGLSLFAFAIVALGIETIVCARMANHDVNDASLTLPIIPWLPPAVWLIYGLSILWIVCGTGLLLRRFAGLSALVFGLSFIACGLAFDVPAYAANVGSVSLRTAVFETAAFASFALLIVRIDALPTYAVRAVRALLGISLVVFGVDHFIALAFIATLLPVWIPWHVFFVALFGLTFIAAGVAIAVGARATARWSAISVGATFALWVLTLHLPRVLGLYGVPGAPGSPAEWQSLLIAVAFCGGSFAYARTLVRLEPAYVEKTSARTA